MLRRSVTFPISTAEFTFEFELFAIGFREANIKCYRFRSIRLHILQHRYLTGKGAARGPVENDRQMFAHDAFKQKKNPLLSIV